MKLLYCVCNEDDKAGGKGRCATILCLLVEEGLLPTAKMSALFNREVVLKVVAVSPTVPGKAQGHPCDAFQSVLSSAWNAVSRINHILTLNISSVAERIN